MIRRRIAETGAAVTVGCPSTWSGRRFRARRPQPGGLIKRGKWAVKLGDFTARVPSDGGGRCSYRKVCGSGTYARPQEEPPTRGQHAGDSPSRESLSPSSAFGQRHRDEARLAAALHPHQHAVLVVVAGGIDGLAHVTGRGHALAGHFEDDVAFLEAAIGRGALRIDLGD